VILQYKHDGRIVQIDDVQMFARWGRWSHIDVNDEWATITLDGIKDGKVRVPASEFVMADIQGDVVRVISASGPQTIVGFVDQIVSRL
jgi:hypothetical protein